MRNSSLQKEQVYQEFLTELMESSSEHKFHTKFLVSLFGCLVCILPITQASKKYSRSIKNV
ncbi:hypothetical protein [Metabacillus endolithicus]|uniref:hypothetical protein n=1 Tax=Metabacillus endolithicus TaxID=1535204 RepID=UPI001FF7FD0B|nr:hypothetical protein [Metabacillus endolithicus]UPG65347.1 hypothetical protein MVE64_10445 [Metabacillus endolithicus]